MDNIEFDFNNKDYIFFIVLEEDKIKIGVIVIEKEKIIMLSEYQKEKYLKNIFELDYEILYKLEKKINPKSLTRIVKYINEALYFYCDTKIRKELLEQNLTKVSSNIDVVWKVEL